MLVLGIVGSMRKGRTTDTLVRRVIEAAARQGSDVRGDVIYTADMACTPCRVTCSSVCTSAPFRCALRDGAAEVLGRMADADAVVLGAPQYFRAPPAGFHTLIERLTSMRFFQESREADAPSLLRGKPCGLVAAAEYSNPQAMLEYLHDASLLLGMAPVRLARYPYLGVAAHGDLETDAVFRPFQAAEELGRALVGACHPSTSREE